MALFPAQVASAVTRTPGELTILDVRAKAELKGARPAEPVPGQAGGHPHNPVWLYCVACPGRNLGFIRNSHLAPPRPWCRDHAR